MEDTKKKFFKSAGGNKCFICNQTDHISSSCPKKKGDGSNCFYCHKPGHTVMKCPEKKVARSNKKNKKLNSFADANAPSGADGAGDARGGGRGGRGGGRGGRGGARGGAPRAFRDGNNNNNNNKRKSADELDDDLVSFNDDGEDNNSDQPLKRRRGDHTSADDIESVETKNIDEDDDELKVIGEDKPRSKNVGISKEEIKERRAKDKNLGDLKSSVTTFSADSQAMFLSKRIKDELKQTDLEAKEFKTEYFVQANQDVKELPDLLRQLHPLLHDLPKKKLKSGSPLVTIVTSSATRAIGISKVLNDFNVKSKVGLYFSKHKKLEEHIDMLNRYPVRIIVGTPSRLIKVAEEGHLKLDGSTLAYSKESDPSEETRWILIDSSFKTKNGLDIFKTCPQELSDLLNLCLPKLESGKMKLVVI